MSRNNLINVSFSSFWGSPGIRSRPADIGPARQRGGCGVGSGPAFWKGPSRRRAVGGVILLSAPGEDDAYEV